MDAAKKKPALSLVIGMGKGKGSDDDEEEKDSDDSGAFSVAAEELFEAIKGDDLEAFKSALKAVKSC